MMRRLCLVVACCAAAMPVTAQTGPRVTISVGAATQPNTVSFVDVTTFPYFAESARLEAAYDVADGIAVDIGGAVRVWRPLAVRVSFTRVTRATGSETRGSFPHPFFFGSNRTGTWTSQPLDRTELGVHVSAAVDVVQHPRFSVSVFGGPTVFNFKQGVVQSVDVIQSYPYDTVDARLVTGTIDGSAVGFHAGVDVMWFFSRHVGVGGLMRFTQGTMKDVRIGEGNAFDLELGGAQGGAGIRLRF